MSLERANLFRVVAPRRSGRIFLAGEMTGCCGSGQAEARRVVVLRVRGAYGASSQASQDKTEQQGMSRNRPSCPLPSGPS
jgi:hypothetical protein